MISSSLRFRAPRNEECIQMRPLANLYNEVCLDNLLRLGLMFSILHSGQTDPNDKDLIQWDIWTLEANRILPKRIQGLAAGKHTI
jgi:hypothetical protein